MRGLVMVEFRRRVSRFRFRSMQTDSVNRAGRSASSDRARSAPSQRAPLTVFPGASRFASPALVLRLLLQHMANGNKNSRAYH